MRLHPLAGTGWLQDLPPARSRSVELQELRRFFSLSFHGEEALLKGLRVLLAAEEGAPFRAYLPTLIEEEERHQRMFQSFCQAHAGGLLPDQMFPFPGESADPTRLLVFFCQAFLFEELLDAYNRDLAQDAGLDPLVREINRLHHEEESRHLAFDLTVIPHILESLDSALGPERMARERAEIAEYLERYLHWLEAAFCTHEAYAAAGLPRPHAASRAALLCGPVPGFHAPALARARRALAPLGLLPAAPAASPGDGLLLQLEAWLLRHSRAPMRGRIPPGLDLIEHGVLDSLLFLKFVAQLEELSGQAVMTANPDLADFRTLERIRARWFPPIRN